MPSPTLLFTPAMFHAAHIARTKTVTRRLAQVSRQNDIDQLAAAIANDDEMAFWNSHTHLAAHVPGQTKPIVTTWAVHTDWDDDKPSQIEPDVIEGEIAASYSGGIWFDDGTEKPSWAGKARPGRFLPKALYHLATQIRIESARPEPLDAITEADALLEGIQPIGDKFGVPDRDGDFRHQAPTACEAYFHLWNTIHPAHPAHTNPIVWRYQFTHL